MKQILALLIAGAVVMQLTGLAHETAQAQAPIDAPVEIAIPIAPTPVKADGKAHLVYELHITNFSPNELTLTRVEVLSGERDSSPLAQYEESELAERLVRPGLLRTAPDRQRIGGGLRAIMFMWLTMDGSASVPATLRHRLTFAMKSATDSSGAPGGDSATGNSVELRGEGGQVAVRSGAPLAIGPPLRGGEWLAANGPSNVSLHRRALIPIAGKPCIAQRFAIDWVQLREDGRTWTGDQLKNSSYRAYGAEILAVADGVVSAIKDGIPENVPGITSRAVTITLETVGGNYVILDLGSNRYAFYAHIQPGSIRVKPGDKVRRGQVLGLVGNSGNSTEPHLHFHISDGNSPIGSEGIPYVFESFTVQGKGWGWKASASNAVPEERRMEIPLQNAVVRFPDAR